MAEANFRDLNASDVLPGVYAGARDVDGVKQVVDATHQEVTV